jgi:hypothetical protein
MESGRVNSLTCFGTIPHYRGATSSVSGLLILLKRHIHSCSHRLHQRLLQWTRPTTRSLLGATLTDLGRTRAELVAENALLRQQLILRRQVKREAVYQDRPAPPAAACAGCQELETGAPHCSARYPPRLASSGDPLGLEETLETSLHETQSCCGDRRLNQNDGAEQSLVVR